MGKVEQYEGKGGEWIFDHGYICILSVHVRKSTDVDLLSC